MKAASTGAILISISLAISGCEKGATDEPAPDEAKPEKVEPEKVEPEKVEPEKVEPEKVEPAADTAAGAAIEGSGAVKIHLLEAGAEPRRQLRLKLDANRGNKMEMRMGMTMRMNIGGNSPPPITLPDMISVMEVTPRTVAADRGVFAWEVTSYKVANTPGVPAALRAELGKQLGALVGAKGTNSLDNRGRNLGATFEMPPGIPPQVAQMLDGMRNALSTMSAPLPQEAVGVGASWRTEMDMVQNGMTAKVAYVFEVKAIKGDRVDLAVELTTAGVPGPFNPPGMPPGTKGRLDSMTGTGAGTVQLDLASVVPVASKIRSNTESQVTVEAMGSKQSVKTSMAIDMAIKSL
jgi:hypothetical protein